MNWSPPSNTGLGNGNLPARNLTHYTALVSGDTISSYEVTIPANVATWTLEELVTGVLYTFTMFSVNDAGRSATSSDSFTQFLVGEYLWEVFLNHCSP